MRIGQQFTARINGREESLVYWGLDNGVHCAKRRPSDWVLFYLKPEQLPANAAQGGLSMEKICGHDWQDIQRAQQGGSLHKSVNTAKPGDYGADPIGNGLFRMVPSGDVVDYAERCRRLKQI